MNELLRVQDLYVQYNTDESEVHAVNGLSLNMHKGETMGLVGETGAGKTTLALSILGILPENVGNVTSGKIFYNDMDINRASKREILSLRGKNLSMIFQDPMTSLNPIISVGDQILEVLDLHFGKMSKEQKNKKVDEILKKVGIPPERKNEYPFQFSGGMKQRIGIAMALVSEPEFLIADEPTTALDVTIQAQILDLMKQLKTEFNTSMIMITHDLGIVAEICDSVSIMYAGEIIENGSVGDIYTKDNNHPYTTGLFNCIPKFDSVERRLSPIEGYMVDPTNLPTGCKFHERCPKAMDICVSNNPSVYTYGTHSIKCFLFEKWQEEDEINE